MARREQQWATGLAGLTAILLALLLAGCPSEDPRTEPAADPDRSLSGESVGQPAANSNLDDANSTGANSTDANSGDANPGESATEASSHDSSSHDSSSHVSSSHGSNGEGSSGSASGQAESRPTGAGADPPPAKSDDSNDPDSNRADAADSPKSDTPKSDTPKSDVPDGNDADTDDSAAKKTYDPLFVNWPRPQAVLVLTGRQSGYVEPCGCTGLENQKGGLARRHTFLKSLAERGWAVAPLDVGSQVRRYGGQAELKFQMSVDALRSMKYGAVAFGGEDLRLSIDALISASVEDSPFISANASILGLSGQQRILKVGERNIGVTAVVGDKDRKQVNNDEVELQPLAEKLPERLQALIDAGCDYVVVLAHTSLEEARQIARKHKQVDLVVTSGGAELPAYRPETFEETDAQLIQVGAKGMYAGVLALYDGVDAPTRFERVPLDDRFADSPDMLRLMKAYQDQLKTLGLEQLGVRPLPHPSGLAFVGSEKCGECHTTAYEIWSETPHAHATDSIKNPYQRSEIARHHDPECLSCHVTGWNPQQYTPYRSGYLDFDGSAHLHGNGCENCHGPGSAHVAAESGEDEVSDEELTMRRVAMRLLKADAEKKCLECHDLDNSPDFHEPGAFERYYKQIEHRGRD